MIRKLAMLLSPDSAGGGAVAAPAAPAAPAKSTPSTSAAPVADTSGGGGEPNPFDAIDGMIAKSRGKEPAKEPNRGGDKQPDDKGDLRDKSKDVAPDPAKKDDKAAPAVDPSRQIQSGPKALRDQLEKTNDELKTFREKSEALEKRIAEFEGKGKDTTALAERLATVEKEKEEALTSLRRIKREASPEFVEKYEKPFKRAADVAEGIVKQLKVLGSRQKVDESSGETTTVTEPVRDAKWDDFVRIFNMPYGQAQEEAEKLFGKSERVIMTHYERLHGLQSEKDLAMKDVQDGWQKIEEKEKADAAMKEQQREKTVGEIQQAWKAVNAEIVDKNPELYAAKPDDKEEASIIQKAYEIWDSKPKTWKGQVIKDAQIRNRLAGFHLAQHRMAKLSDRVAELESALAEAKGSRPGATRKAGGDEKPAEKSWKADLQETLAAG